MQPAKAVSRIDAIASRRVRLSMLLVLALIAMVVVVQAWQAGKAEASRSTDAEIITLAGAQRVHSQRIARLALQSANDTAQIELDMVLLNSEAQALLLERLLADQGMMAPDPLVASDNDTAFREAIKTWQTSRVQFVASVNRFVQARETYEFAELPLVSRAIQKQADVFFLNSQRLVEQAQIFAQSHGETATRSSLNWTALIMALLGLLAVGVVEPTARFVRRQYELLKAQTDEMQRLALVAATTSNWVIVASTRRKVSWANRAFLAGVGLTSEQVLDKDFLSFVSPKGNDLEELGRAGEELKQGLGVRVEVLALARDGQGVWLDVDCQPLFDDQGAVTGFLAVGNDVTEQVNQRRKLRALFDALPVGVILYTKTGAVADCNTTALKMTQLQVHEFANYETMTVVESQMHPGVRTVRDDLSDYPIAEQPVVRTLETRRGLRRESVGYLRADGKIFWTLVSTEPLIDAQGQVSGVVECFLDVSRQKRLEQQLRDISRTDNLTQLPNRVVVTDQIRAALLRRHAQPGYHFAVLFMDFDRFKQVNDTLGHGVGDELLRQIAQRLQVSLRPGDSFVRTSDFGQMAARIGGDEFVVVLDDIRGDLDAEVVAGRLLDVLAVPYVIGTHTVNSSVSIGIVTATHATDEVESVLRDADIAMYEAKRTGRGRYVMFDPAMHRRVRDDVSLENDLRQALGQGELFVVYQPLIDLNSGALAGMEALVRWKHPQRGMVSPVEFIPVAEAGGLIARLGAFVLQTACAEFAAMRVILGADAPGSVSVNLSRAQLREPDLVANIQDVLRSNGLAAGQLQLEITESLAAQDHAVQAKLREIKALGVTLALDDFGTGYSSLSCLHELPIDTVKIDRAFVSVAQGSDYHRVLIEATILVAETLGMSTVAEGIETADQADMMRALRCSKGQGYLYSKPLQRDELVQWIEASRALA